MIERPIKMRRIIQKHLSNLLLCLLIVNPAAKVSNKLLMSSEKSYLNAVQCLELNRQKSSFFFRSKFESRCKKSMSNNKLFLSGNTHSLFHNENLSVHYLCYFILKREPKNQLKLAVVGLPFCFFQPSE